MRYHIVAKLLAMLVASVLLSAVVGCGVTPTGSSLLGSSSSPVPATPTRTAAHGTPTRTPQSTPSSSTGSVRVLLDKGQYGSAETIRVTIRNNSGGPLQAADHRTNCTILQMQSLFNGVWEPVGKCRAQTATRLIEIEAGSAMTFDLAPGGTPPAWQAGTYRVELGYMSGTDGTAGSPGVASSVVFTIG